MSHPNERLGISVMAQHNNKRVALQFEREVHWIGLSPEQAVELAYTIYEKAQELAPSSSIITLPNGFSRG